MFWNSRNLPAMSRRKLVREHGSGKARILALGDV
jgi:hypothetical protein